MMPQLIGGWGAVPGQSGVDCQATHWSAGRGADDDRFRLAGRSGGASVGSLPDSISLPPQAEARTRDARKAARITPIPHLPERASYETITSHSLKTDRRVPCRDRRLRHRGPTLDVRGPDVLWWDAPVLT